MGKHNESHCFNLTWELHSTACLPVYPLVNQQKAIEHDPFIVDLPIKNSDFP